jgi:hypothetical protein
MARPAGPCEHELADVLLRSPIGVVATAVAPDREEDSNHLACESDDGDLPSNRGTVLADFTNTPGVLEFDVSFRFEATSARPLIFTRAHRETVIRVTGAGFASDAGPTEVRFTDEGGGSAPFTVRAAIVDADGTGLISAIPAATMATAIGPIRLDVRAGDDMGAVPMPALEPVVAGLRDDARATVGPVLLPGGAQPRVRWTSVGDR